MEPRHRKQQASFSSFTICFVALLRPLPTDAQENCFKRITKIHNKTVPTCFGVITIIRERTI